MRRSPSLALGRLIIITMLTLIAMMPWALNAVSAPLVPPALAATPTGYAIAKGTSDAATKTAKPPDVMRPLASGISNKDLVVYRCPQGGLQTGERLPANQEHDFAGYYRDPGNQVWFLVADRPDTPERWVKGHVGLTLSPEQYEQWFQRPTECRRGGITPEAEDGGDQ